MAKSSKKGDGRSGKLKRIIAADRKRLSGPEDRLVSELLHLGLPRGLGEFSYLLREPRLPMGYPDLVFLASSPTKAARFYSKKIGDFHFRLMQINFDRATSDFSVIANYLNAKKGEVEIAIRDLVKSGIVDEAWVKTPRQSLYQAFLPRRILAIEAKVGNWREAINQAVANLWFASESYILIPPTRNVTQVLEYADQHGVGVLASVPGAMGQVRFLLDKRVGDAVTVALAAGAVRSA